jgi:bacteriocin-like protein
MIEVRELTDQELEAVTGGSIKEGVQAVGTVVKNLYDNMITLAEFMVTLANQP